MPCAAPRIRLADSSGTVQAPHFHALCANTRCVVAVHHHHHHSGLSHSTHTALPCFSVADHNTDGVLQYDEFVLLLNHITAEISDGGNLVVSTKVCRQLFKEASEAGHPHGITPSVFASAVHGELWMQPLLNHLPAVCSPETWAWLCVCLLVAGTITTLTARWANQRDAEREGAKNKAKALASATPGAGAGSGGGGGGAGLGSGGEGGRKRGMRGAVLAAAMTQMSRRPPVTARDAGHSSSSKEKSLPSIKS